MAELVPRLAAAADHDFMMTWTQPADHCFLTAWGKCWAIAAMRWPLVALMRLDLRQGTLERRTVDLSDVDWAAYHAAYRRRLGEVYAEDVEL